MTTQIAIRLDDGELTTLDTEVAQGRAANRSEAVRHGIARLQREQRYRHEEATLTDLVERGEDVYPDLDGLLDLPHPALD
jgi:Arc/MetJ-type ribon-helix-helix transcriptional regulator